MSESFRGTDKQIEILRVIQRRNVDGTPVDTAQILAALTYAPTRAALKSSVNFLKKHKMISTGDRVRAGQKRTTYFLTTEGFNFMKEVS